MLIKKSLHEHYHISLSLFLSLWCLEQSELDHYLIIVCLTVISYYLYPSIYLGTTGLSLWCRCRSGSEIFRHLLSVKQQDQRTVEVFPLWAHILIKLLSLLSSHAGSLNHSYFLFLVSTSWILKISNKFKWQNGTLTRILSKIEILIIYIQSPTHVALLISSVHSTARHWAYGMYVT